MAMAQHPATSQVTPLQESPLHTSQSLISQDSAGSPVEKERASSHVAEAGICGAVGVAKVDVELCMVIWYVVLG